MSWYKTYYSEKEIDFTSSYLDYRQFILQQFFNSDDNTWLKIARYYRDQHGNRALGYLQRKFHEWKDGDYHLTDLMQSRILDVMPRFLTFEAKQKLGLYEFLSTIKSIVKNKELKKRYNSENIDSFKRFVDIIKEELENINETKLPPLRFNMLGKKEKSEVLNISKYILKIKLQSIYKHITKDIEVVSPYFRKNNLDRFSISYSANFGSYKLHLENKELGRTTFPEFEISNIKSNNQYDIYAERYLAYELKDILNERSKNVVDGFLTTTDIDIFLSKYLELKKSTDCEVKMKGEFNGEIGQLKMNVHYIPPKLLDIEINKKRFSAGLKILATLFILLWIGESDNWEILIGLWFFAIPGAIALYSSINEDFKEVKELQDKKKQYSDLA